MPRVTISISGAPREQSDADLLTLDLPPGLTVQDLKGFVEAETSFPAASQTFFLNGRPLASPNQTLEDAGIKDGEMLAVHVRRPPRQTDPTRGTRHPNPSGSAQGTDESEIIRQNVLHNPAAQENLKSMRPDLFAALHDPARWKQVYETMARQKQEAEREHQRQIALLNEDPFNIEAQKKIEEIIRQDRVYENLQHAYEHNPEVFTRVHMLYVNTEVNDTPVKAFVDSGAQATIMSPDCAERCGIMRLMDTRYSGMARGVGTARILGRVHHAEIKIGGAVMPCAFTVMEGKDVDLLFGLDMLKRYKAKIDLEKNALCFAGLEVPFLPESEIPKGFEESEPTVPGPNNTEIGGITGQVKPAGDEKKGTGPSTEPRPGPSAQAPSTAQPTPASDGFPAEDIDQLVNLGFSRQDAVQALQATNGNVEFAASLLFSHQ